MIGWTLLSLPERLLAVQGKFSFAFLKFESMYNTAAEKLIDFVACSLLYNND